MRFNWTEHDDVSLSLTNGFFLTRDNNNSQSGTVVASPVSSEHDEEREDPPQRSPLRIPVLGISFKSQFVARVYTVEMIFLKHRYERLTNQFEYHEKKIILDFSVRLQDI